MVHIMMSKGLAISVFLTSIISPDDLNLLFLVDYGVITIVQFVSLVLLNY